MADHPLSIIYNVRLTPGRYNRVQVCLVRGDYCKKLAHCYPGYNELVFTSDKPRPFFDEEDERLILEKCKNLDPSWESKVVGSIELQVFVQPENCIEVRYTSGRPFATWDPERGLRWWDSAHSVFKGDKKHIAKVCYEFPQGIGGIFKKDSEEEGTSL